MTGMDYYLIAGNCRGCGHQRQEHMHETFKCLFGPGVWSSFARLRTQLIANAVFRNVACAACAAPCIDLTVEPWVCYSCSAVLVFEEE